VNISGEEVTVGDKDLKKEKPKHGYLPFGFKEEDKPEGLRLKEYKIDYKRFYPQNLLDTAGKPISHLSQIFGKVVTKKGGQPPFSQILNFSVPAFGIRHSW